MVHWRWLKIKEENAKESSGKDDWKKQKEIAAYLMCDQSLYSKYEREERSLPLEYADKLADFYGVSVDYLLCRTNEKRPYPKK
mgnify:CR=1 FL=1